jgi:hypothetical protein
MVPDFVQCGGCAVTGNANERGTPIEREPAVRFGTPLSANPLFALVPADSNYTAKTAGAESSLRMQLALLFPCVLFSFFYVSGLVLIVQSGCCRHAALTYWQSQRSGKARSGVGLPRSLVDRRRSASGRRRAAESATRLAHATEKT